jgi:hypothetical protein
MTKEIRPMVRIHNTETDEVIDREMNDDEFVQYTADQEAYAIKQAKAIAEGKLAALGLTTDDLRALGL